MRDLAAQTGPVEEELELTIVDLVQILARRWALLLGLLLVTGLSAVHLSSAHIVYWSETDVRFVAPGPQNSNSLLTTTDSVIATAGLIATEYNDSNPGPRLSSDDVSIVDAGILDGVLVRLPNAGGQWATNFNEPRLDVQASGSDPEEVRARAVAAVASIERLLRQHQQDAHVVKTELIVPHASPAVPIVAEAVGSRVRALVVTAVVGSALSIGLVLYLDQLMLRRSLAKSRSRAQNWTNPINLPLEAAHRRR